MKPRSVEAIREGRRLFEAACAFGDNETDENQRKLLCVARAYAKRINEIKLQIFRGTP